MEAIFVKFTESAAWKKAFKLVNVKNPNKFRIEFFKLWFSRAICNGDHSGQSSSWSSSGGGQVCCCCFYSEQMAQETSASKFEQNLLLFFARKPSSSATPTNINVEKFYRNRNALLDFSFYFKHSISIR